MLNSCASSSYKEEKKKTTQTASSLFIYSKGRSGQAQHLKEKKTYKEGISVRWRLHLLLDHQ